MTFKPTFDEQADIMYMWNIGKSAREIGEKFGVSRNVIIGRVNRLRQKGWSVNSKGDKAQAINALKSYKRKKKKPNLAPKAEVIPLRPARYVPKTAVPGYVIIQDLGPNQCKYAVRMSKAGEHLFCALPAEGVYCKEHHAKCYDTVRTSKRVYKPNAFGIRHRG